MGLRYLSIPLVLALLGGPAARAEEPPKVVVDLSEWWAAPRNVELDYAFVDPSQTLSGGGELKTLSHDAEPVTAFRAGYRLGGSEGPVLSLSFWEQDTTASGSTGELPAMVGALLASPDFSIGNSFVDSAEATSRIKSSQVDADFRWTRDLGPSSVVSFDAGIRAFRYEREETVTYAALDDATAENLLEVVLFSTDTTGVGPKAAVSFGRRLGTRTVVGAGLGFAVPIGQIESSASDTAFTNGAFLLATVVERPGTKRAFFQIDGDVHVDVALLHGLTLYASYSFHQWSGVTLEQRFVDVVSQNTTLPTEQDVIHEGPAIGLRYEWGQKP